MGSGEEKVEGLYPGNDRKEQGSFALGIIMQLLGGWTKYTRDDAYSRTSVHNPAGYSTLV